MPFVCDRGVLILRAYLPFEIRVRVCGFVITDTADTLVAGDALDPVCGGHSRFSK